MSLRKKQTGFTLIELIIIVAIIAILLVWAIPNFAPILRGYELRSSVDRVNNSIGWARAEAIRQQKFVMIEPDSSGWQGGWKVCIDGEAQDSCSTAATLLRTEEPMDNKITAAAGSVSIIKINPSGMLLSSGKLVELTNGGKTTKLSLDMNRVIIKQL